MREYIQQSISAKQTILDDEMFLNKIQWVSEVVVNSLLANRKILFIGSGQAASDCDKLAAEFNSKFHKDNHSYCAISLCSNNAILTGLSEDFGYEWVFARQLEALAQKGDVLFVFSASGNSKSISLALETAKKMGVMRVGFTGQSNAESEDMFDLLLKVPSDNSFVVQENHAMIGHLICKSMDERLFGSTITI